MNDINRRRFLKRAGITAGVGLAGIAGTAASSRAANLQIHGRVQKTNKKPARRDFVGVAGRNLRVNYIETNDGGVFDLELNQPRNVAVGYYQMTPNARRIPSPKQDGSPDIYYLQCCVDVSNRPVNLGTFQLPEAYLLQVLATDEAGSPIEDARVRVVQRRFGGGWGSGTHTTNSSGLLQYADADHPGTELVGDVLVQVSPPADDGHFVDRTYEREIELQEPRTETFVLEKR
ncbi:twin-arginine translocation signal domain-containing protein [Haloarchaeobius sp. HME9146]|uniref:twin-arginine translocation signal domain-containing protein n=1 Tax=Haloarchaeobius sp. HME9146 TaxID=2978732 RepID=UPI0021BE7143|nr:twin-arginine translocation signal domain-containing protein [Haloarchaeobius sp. HME9146]MCT9095510.1 twin-arginine translocation signal domain-containing protein [Haloarchaeobius sp. HME9146]